MACSSCAAARARVAANARSGNISGTIRALGSGAKMMAQHAVQGRQTPTQPQPPRTIGRPPSFIRKI